MTQPPRTPGSPLMPSKIHVQMQAMENMLKSTYSSQRQQTKLYRPSRLKPLGLVWTGTKPTPKELNPTSLLADRPVGLTNKAQNMNCSFSTVRPKWQFPAAGWKIESPTAIAQTQACVTQSDLNVQTHKYKTKPSIWSLASPARLEEGVTIANKRHPAHHMWKVKGLHEAIIS